MAKVFVHAASATAGGGVTYVKNVVPLLGTLAARHEWHVLLPEKLEESLRDAGENVRLESADAAGPVKRVLFDQVTLRKRLVRERFDVLLAVGNFGLVWPPVPQVLFSRNALYFSENHVRELRRRRLYKMWLQICCRRALTLACIKSSTFNVTPTRAFQDHIRRFGRVDETRFRTIHHGFDAERFRAGGEELKPEHARLLGPRDRTARILFVSHYNYFRNFETVLEAVALLKGRLERPFKLVLTTKLGHGVRENQYDTTAAAALIDRLGIASHVVMLGHVGYQDLYAVYRASDLAVCASYAETFGHPMVEAMSSGLPVVATDMDVHREVCQEGAVYFDVFNPSSLAAQIAKVLEDPGVYHRLADAGRRRAECFSWETHVKELSALVEEACCVRDGVRVATPE